jgi:hypothetical protein
MQRPPMNVNPEELRRSTHMARMRVENAVRLASEITQDSRKQERLAAQRCKACFYFVGVAGAAMTSRPCGLCGENQMYGSTSASALCTPCGAAHQLCRHCGGDLEMNTARSHWPAGYFEPSPAGPQARA